MNVLSGDTPSGLLLFTPFLPLRERLSERDADSAELAAAFIGMSRQPRLMRAGMLKTGLVAPSLADTAPLVPLNVKGVEADADAEDDMAKARERGGPRIPEVRAAYG